MKKIIGILWGIAFIIFGIIIGLNSLDITNINIFFDGWWTLFIIVPSFIDLFDGNDITGSIIGMIIGVALLLCCQGLITFDLLWKLTIPTIFVLIGITIIFKSSFSKTKKIVEKDRKSLKVYCATFGGQDVNLSNEEFKGANIIAVFGGVDCNLEESKIVNDEVIYATAIFAGIDINVPKDVNIVISSFPLFGAVSNKRKKIKSKNAKTIYIKAISIFGGIEIK